MTAKRAKPGPKEAASAPSPSLGGALPMGTTATLHPPIGLGLWSLGRWSAVDEARTKATCARAVERGVVWYDTAEVYGNGRSERLLGDVLDRRAPGSPSAFVTTKVSWEHLRPAQVRAACQGSLQRLGRRQIDVYLVHAPDPRVPITETMGALESLWKEGKVGAIGVSNFSLEQLEAAERALSEAPLVVHQVLYNLFDREEGDAILEHCVRRGIVVEAYTPLCRGLLAGRYLGKERPSAEVRRFAQRTFGGDRFPELVERARAIRALALDEGVPMASIALHWLARKGVAPVVGASRPEQVDDLVAAWSAHPSDALLAEAERVALGDAA